SILVVIVVVALVAAVGYVFRSSVLKPPFDKLRAALSNVEGPSDATVRVKPGTTSDTAAAATPRAEISIDSRRQQLIGVRTASAKRVPLAQTIRTTGNVRPDESRQTDVNLKIEGWIRDLYVDYTGQSVKKDQPLFTLYSPDFYTTEQEYILALKSRDQMQS